MAIRHRFRHIKWRAANSAVNSHRSQKHLSYFWMWGQVSVTGANYRSQSQPDHLRPNNWHSLALFDIRQVTDVLRCKLQQHS